MATKMKKYDVGGIELDRPFKIRRLGHFGFNATNFDACVEFYTRLMGFSISDPINFGHRIDEKERDTFATTTGFFMRHGTDHHSFVIFPRDVMWTLAGKPEYWDGHSINQITWQVSSLAEVVAAESYLGDQQVGIRRSGRDNPGSNWHVYPFDPDGNLNEIYYGIEQVGWDGRSKPRDLHLRNFAEKPELPQIPEYEEVQNATAAGVDPSSGYRYEWPGADETYDVGGVLLPRPFKVVGIGPLHLLTDDMENSLQFYRDRMGLTVCEEITWNGHRAVFLRANTEHHSIGLYDEGIRQELGLSDHSTCLSFGLKMGSYKQLRDALGYLGDNDVEIKYLPPELLPGMEHTAFAVDPDGHLIQLYHYMEQIGWDGRPRPADQRPAIDNGNWPETLDPRSDTGSGEVFMGPWG